jgi:chromate transporter
VSARRTSAGRARAPLRTVAREWTRIGVIGFGGPPAHIALLRDLVVRRRRWMDAREFEDAIAASSLLPGPASTQLAIFCAYRVAGPAGAVIGGLGFVLPAVILILALSAVFLGGSPPRWIRSAGAGAGAVLAAVAVHAARGLLGPSLGRVASDRVRLARWGLYVLAGALAALLLGSYLVLVLLGCGLCELAIEHGAGTRASAFSLAVPVAVVRSGIGALAWTSFKVGALAFGGGFVIVPLMHSDAVHVYHWMSDQQFLNAVALGQITPGPVVATVAAVGYAAHGVAGGAVAAAVRRGPRGSGRQFRRSSDYVLANLLVCLRAAVSMPRRRFSSRSRRPAPRAGTRSAPRTSCLDSFESRTAMGRGRCAASAYRSSGCEPTFARPPRRPTRAAQHRSGRLRPPRARSNSPSMRR